MKRVLFLILVVTTCLQGIYAQVTDSVYYERLYYTCKVWGHAKYYHSKIAAGEVNWDDVLLNALPGIKNASDNQSFNDSLLLMLLQAGETETGGGTLPQIPDSLNNNVDISWIYHPIFSETVSALLDTIMQRFTPQSNVYVGSYPVGNPNFEDFDKQYYSGDVYPDEGKRILAVFRYWNIIHYFFPYKYIMDQEWDTSLIQSIPEVVKASNELEYHLAMRVFTAKINDTHSFFSSSIFNQWMGSYYTPFLARFIEGKVVITKVHFSVPELSPGDIVKKIDGVDIDVLRDSLKKYSYGSNEISIERNLIDDIILSGAYGQFSLTISNETGEHTFSLERRTYRQTLLQDNTPYWQEITQNGCRFGIVNMGKLKTSHFPKIIDDFRNVDTIIFDIRNYPNGTLWTLVDYFFEKPINIANFTFPDNKYPGRLYWQKAVIGQGTSDPIRKKVKILFDERTQSQAEYTCMGLEQIPDAIKIGSTTAAADGNVSYIYLPGRITATATFLGTYYPDYTPTQRVGIIPDYEVRPTIQGIRENRDEVLEFALNCGCVKIDDVVKNERISVFPNPTNGQLQITNYESQITNVEIFDLMGKNVFQLSTLNSQFSTQIDISHLPVGIYFVKIKTETGVVTKKY